MTTITNSSVRYFEHLGRYFYAEGVNGKHKIALTIAPGYAQVIVQNASNRAWRGMGKRFPSIDTAIANYKTPAIQQILRDAAAANAADLRADEGVAVVEAIEAGSY